MDKVRRLLQLAEEIESFFDAVHRYSNLPLEMVLKEHPGFRTAVLGGVRETGDYLENSLAKVFREQLGVWIDARQYAALAAFGEADRRVSLETRESPVRTLAASVRVLCDKVSRGWGEESPRANSQEGRTSGAYLDAPLEVIGRVQELLQLLADLSAGADEGTTLVFMTRRITGHYLRSSFLKDAPE